MLNKTSKLQKVIIVTIGVLTKSQPFMKRLQLTKVFKENLERNDKNISVILTSSLNSLHKQRLIIRRRGDIQLTESGKQLAREVIDEIKKDYGKVDWVVLKEFLSK